MKIAIKSNFGLYKTDFETQSTTLGDLLAELSRDNNPLQTHFFDPEKREINPRCILVLNDQKFEVLADGLNTKLKDGDKIEIFLNVVRGG